MLLSQFVAAPLGAQNAVQVAPVVLAPIVEELPLSGSVVSPRYSDISPQVSGLIIDIRVEPGDRVEAGEALLELDSASASLSLEMLSARHDEAKLAFEEASRLAKEGERLVADRNLPQSEYESRRAREGLEAARLRQLDAQLQQQQLDLERHQLRAPFSGLIGLRHAEVGEWVNAGDPALQLVQIHPIRVQASVPERFFGEVRSGTPVSILFDAFPGEEVASNVDRVVASGQQDTRSFLVWMDLPNTEGRFAPGMSAQLRFALADEGIRRVLQVPADAIVHRSDGSAEVWLVEERTARSVRVTVGRRAGNQVEVSGEGLAEGSLVVTLGNESLRNGQTVKPVEAASGQNGE